MGEILKAIAALICFVIVAIGFGGMAIVMIVELVKSWWRKVQQEWRDRQYSD